MTKKIVFAGCSYTSGYGWAEDDKIEVKDSPNLWVNICHHEIPRFNELELINIGQCGASNTDIFTNVIRTMSLEGSTIDILICQWTSGPRYNWHVGFELWNTSQSLFFVNKHDINLNRGDHWPKEFVQDLTNRLLVMHHPHWEILKVVDYSNIILNLAQQLGIVNVFFINGLCPWDRDYFVKLEDVLPESYTKFTKTHILNIDTRDDKDIVALYDLAHKHYQEKGGIQSEYWLNLYDSFHNNKIDTNFDNKHPGIESNLLYYKMIETKLKELKFL